MADPTTKTFGQLVSQQAAAIQARASGLVDFTVGSVLRAIAQSVAAVVLWLQALVLRILALTRLATSAGADADTFVADFGGPFTEGGAASFARLGAKASAGQLTFSRLSTTGTALVPVGATVETADGSQRFVITANPASGDYDADLGGYVLGVGDAEVDVPAASVSSGSAANVLAGTVTVITSAIVGVDQVTNADDFVAGADPESDGALRVRFRAYLQSLREATVAAVLSYVRAVQPGVDPILVENEEISGAVRRGFFYVVADDGSGDPSEDFLNAVRLTIDTHRAAGIEFAAYAPEEVDVDITVAFVTLAEGAVEASAQAAVEAAIGAHISALKIGEDVVFNRLYQVAYDATPDLLQANITLESGTANVVIGPTEVANLGTLTVG